MLSLRLQDVNLGGGVGGFEDGAAGYEDVHAGVDEHAGILAANTTVNLDEGLEVPRSFPTFLLKNHAQGIAIPRI